MLLSLTDTFGLVTIEALACGTPVAAFDVPGPRDVLACDVAAIGPDLRECVQVALGLDREKCVSYARGFSWAAATDQFEAGLAPTEEVVAADAATI